MIRLLVFSSLVIEGVASALDIRPTATKDWTPPRVTVDLNKPPEHRWTDIVAARKEPFLAAINTIFAAPQIRAFVPALKLVVGNAIVRRNLLIGDQLREAEAIARQLGVDVADIVLASSFYDLFAAKGSPVAFAACTGVVAQNAAGEILHGRNLDYGFRDALGNSTLVVDFLRDGHTLFTAVTFGPMPTFNTVVRWGSFSLSQDERDRGSLFQNLWDVVILGRPASFSRIRQAAETLERFEDVVNYFSTVELDAAAYYIVGGTKRGEGAVVTRDRLKAADVWRLNATAGRWYVLETNYDHMLPPPHGDDRRHPLQRAMNATGPEHIDPESMWAVISTRTVNSSAGERGPLNDETIYSTIMQAANPASFKTMVRGHPVAPEENPPSSAEELLVVI